MTTIATGELPAPGAAALGRREPRQPSARSLLLTVLGEYVLPGGEPVWTATLVRVLALLGVAEKTARQALARTAAEGWIASRRHGRLAQWELTEAGQRLLTEGAHRIYTFGQDGPDWDGRWLVLLTGAQETGPEDRHRVRAQLAWAGFGALPGGVWVSPDPRREQRPAGSWSSWDWPGRRCPSSPATAPWAGQADVVALPRTCARSRPATSSSSPPSLRSSQRMTRRR